MPDATVRAGGEPLGGGAQEDLQNVVWELTRAGGNVTVSIVAARQTRAGDALQVEFQIS